MDHFLNTNGIRLHYLDYGGQGESLILLHGLTANASSFEGLINARLNQHMRVISVDLRGRGLTDKPATGYSLEDHAQDILGLLDALKIDQAILGGHSYGGRLAVYIAAHYPQRVKKLVLMDIGFMHPRVADLIMPSVMRLDKIVPSWDAYIEAIRQSPPYHGGFWNEELEAYYRADVETLEDGSVKPRSVLANIIEAVQTAEMHDWHTLYQQVKQPTILLHAPDGYGPGDTPGIITEEGARQAVNLMSNCEYKRMSGNHMTMLFGEHASKVVDATTTFVVGG